MTRALLVLVAGLTICLLGTLTATDAISLRQIVYNVPVLSSLVLAARRGMCTGVPPSLDPACALAGASVMLLALRLTPAVPALRLGSARTARAFAAVRA